MLTAGAVEELLALPEVRVGWLDGVMIIVWRGRITVELLERVNTVEALLLERCDALCVMGVITELSHAMPEVDLRAAAVAAMERFQDRVRGTALVVSALGVKAVLARTFLAGLSLVMTFRSPLKAFRTTGEAIEWFRVLPGFSSPAELREPVDAFIAGALRSG